MKLEEKLIHLRKEEGLSQSKLAEMMGVSRQTISRWETGTSVPTSENMKYLSRLYGVSLDELLHNDVTLATVKRDDDIARVESSSTGGDIKPKCGKNRKTRNLLLAVLLMLLAMILLYVVAGDRRDDGPVKISELEKSETQADRTLDFDLDMQIQ